MYRGCVAIIMGGTPSLISEKVMDLKDKLKLFQRIRNDKYAETDLQLLKAKCPSYLFIPRFERDPKRYANDIQYALLDVVQVEEIIKNRTLADGSSKTLTDGEVPADSSPEVPSDTSSEASSETSTEEESSKKK